MAAYLDHVGYLVQDLDWTVSFFEEVFDMSVERFRENPNGVREVWLQGGLQLIDNGCFDGTTGRGHHVCLIVDDLEAIRAKALARGCSELPKYHWIRLPDGLEVEMFTAAPGAIETLKGIVKR